MTNEEFWEGVGAQLRKSRLRAGLRPHHISLRGGPEGKIVSAMEDSADFRTIDSLQRYADVLGVSLVDVFKSVLCPTKNGDGNPQVERLVRVSRALPQEKFDALLTLLDVRAGR